MASKGVEIGFHLGRTLVGKLFGLQGPRLFQSTSGVLVGTVVQYRENWSGNACGSVVASHPFYVPSRQDGARTFLSEPVFESHHMTETASHQVATSLLEIGLDLVGPMRWDHVEEGGVLHHEGFADRHVAVERFKRSGLLNRRKLGGGGHFDGAVRGGSSDSSRERTVVHSGRKRGCRLRQASVHGIGGGWRKGVALDRTSPGGIGIGIAWRRFGGSGLLVVAVETAD